MTTENVFDQFLKDQLSFLKGNYDRFEFKDLKPAINQATHLGYFELGESEDSFRLLCSLLKKSVGFDGGFAMTVFIQAIARKIFRAAGHEEKGLFAYQPFQSRESGLNVAFGNGKYRVSGTAKMVALGHEASHFLFCNEGEGASFFLIKQSEITGFERVSVIGMRTLPLYDLKLENAEAELVGKEGSAAEHFSNMTRPLRIAASAMMFGLLEASYREASSYAHERVQGGRKIIEWSEHKMMLSRVFARLKVCESLLAYGLDREETLTDAESISTLIHFQESLAEMTSASVQAMGGAGYMKDYPLERFYRDGHQLRCLFGTAPFHKLDLFSREGIHV